ncbi:hypothetical protein GPECTOR_220g472 [Gonium pectorale]|uniref:tRNA-uridine aminocarboxypropyltransferase 1 n=1 Tax=Gonium pectorale TaxID=33097 RepID=A0A150FWM6_GONPE|nr:hypothetical protein GPECTOR_220g472 [Gonium pectorale]|eukprot:KXZ42024.1 hypothetical protein GPECTOR_220g472 [Gonium pectorale]
MQPKQEGPAVAKLAARRPDWELPEVHAGLQLSSLEPLHSNKERIKCSKCGRSRAHYCYDCVQPLVPFPHVALPFRVSIVTHHEEKASKNTGVQVAILAAGQVDLHSMAAVPRDVDPSRCAVLFPSDTALEVSELEPDSIDRLFIIDSRWKKAGELVRTETFAAMRAVKLSETRSAFWRFHTRGVADEGVCTIEALYFFLVAMAKLGKLTDPRFTAPHAFDDLLWYFVYQHQVVQQAAKKRLEGQAGSAPAGAEQPQREQSQGQGQGQGQGHDRGGGAPGKQQQQKQKQKQKQKQQGKQGQQIEQEGGGPSVRPAAEVGEPGPMPCDAAGGSGDGEEEREAGASGERPRTEQQPAGEADLIGTEPCNAAVGAQAAAAVDGGAEGVEGTAQEAPAAEGPAATQDEGAGSTEGAEGRKPAKRARN